jgi:hypothetical protein
MNRTRAAALALLAIAGALVIAGCGDDDETTTSDSGATLTKDEFIAKADAICAAGDQALTAAVQALGNGRPSQADLQRFAELAVPALQEQVDGIRALTPPAGDEDRVSAMLDAVQNGIDRIETDPSSIESDPLKAPGQLAEDYGLQECG